jgi:KUP system potassium uptake protein
LGRAALAQRSATAERANGAQSLRHARKDPNVGYVPLLLAALVYGVMFIWHHGSVMVAQRLREEKIPVEEFMRSIKSRNIPRVPGTGVFLTRTAHIVPPVMIWHVKHNRSCR